MLQPSKVLAGKMTHPSSYLLCAFGATQAGLVQKQFRKQAADYDRSAQNKKEVLDWVKEQLPLSADASVLDNCAGTALVGRTIAPHVKKVTSVDISRHMLEVGKQKAAAENVNNIEFLNGDATQLPFEDGSFDMVVTRLGLTYFSTPGAAIREMVRVCKPGGCVAIVERIADPSLTQDLMERMDWLESLRDSSHQSFQTPPSLVKLLQQERVSVSSSNPTGLGAGIKSTLEIEENLEDYLTLAQTVKPNKEIFNNACQGYLNYPDSYYDQETGFKPLLKEGVIFVTHKHVMAVGHKQ